MGLTEKPHSLVVSVGSRPKNITFHVHELSSKPSQPAGIQIFRREAFDFEKKKWLCVFHDDVAFEYSCPSSFILAVRNGCIRRPVFCKLSIYYVSIQDEEIYL